MAVEDVVRVEKEETNSLNSYNLANDPRDNSITMAAAPAQDATEMMNHMLHGGVDADVKGKIQAV